MRQQGDLAIMFPPNLSTTVSVDTWVEDTVHLEAKGAGITLARFVGYENRVYADHI